MTDSHDIHLIVRENQQEARKQARQAMLQAAFTGRGLDMEEVAKARGLVLRERENSVFSDAWIPLAVIFILLGYLFNREPALLALGFVLLIIVGVSTFWKNMSLVGVTYERSFNRTRVFPGEEVEMTITVQNDKALPLTWLQFRDELPVTAEADVDISRLSTELTGRYLLYNTFSLYGRQQTQRTARFHFPTRGYYQLGPVTYESGDIFTLFTISRQHDYQDTLIVYPQIYPLAQLGLPAKEPFGELKVRRSLFTDPIKTQGIRDYQPEDRFRDVHWKATARRGQLQTKIYDPSTGMTMAIFLNVSTFERHWMGFDPELLERAISVAASIANYGDQQKWAIGIYANGSVPGSDQPIRVAPSRSPVQLSNVLEALAAVSEFATGSIDRMMIRESTALPWAATVVLVTANVNDELMVTLVRLQEAGRRVVLISLADDPPPTGLGRITTYHIPSNAPAFQAGPDSITATEAALSQIPTPVPVDIRLDQYENGDASGNGRSPQQKP